ncbi:hypothetical protein FAES_4058 [Fibrella aestuarina BUZ 2]|uniref:Uncharacterized protein n=1 Tax=Fibrella aestuarina BUZ 2 TaxID=1166018 RepID=I0KD55_9BACT|nr:hypothetical protein [Fibrella aestuarina]CCH02058.1 hypothetical protein FAES_4058 [Fibrella aestuarina BUZ 2]
METLIDPLRRTAPSIIEHIDTLCAYLMTDARPPQGALMHPHTAIDLDLVLKYLVQGWTAEYCLRSTPLVEDGEVLNHYVPITYPHAFYSPFCTVQALLAAEGQVTSTQAECGRAVAKLVREGLYPETLSFWATGRADDLTLRADLIMTLTLVETRQHQLRHGEIDDSYTTWYDILGRLQLSTRNRELPMLADLDGKTLLQFQQQLATVVRRINAVHEATLRLMLGTPTWRLLLTRIPDFLQDAYQEWIQPAQPRINRQF